jgi:hypothetical protein
MPSGGGRIDPVAAASVAAVVVSHNTRGLLERCLAELDREGRRVVVVDNASADGSAELVRDRFPTLEVVECAENRGFGAGANKGIAALESRYVLLLNPDAWPLAGAVERLVSVAERNPRVGVVAPRLLNPDGTPQQSVFGYPTRPALLASWAAFPRLVGAAARSWRRVRRIVERAGSKGRALGECEAVIGDDFPVGAALLIRRDAFDEAGGFDESFFMYSEETDLCRRLRDLGWDVFFCPSATFVHVGAAATSQSKGAMYREQLRSYLRYIAKHRGATQADRARALLAGTLRLRAFALRRDSRSRDREAARWLASSDLESLLR